MFKFSNYSKAGTVKEDLQKFSPHFNLTSKLLAREVEPHFILSDASFKLDKALWCCAIIVAIAAHHINYLVGLQWPHRVKACTFATGNGCKDFVVFAARAVKIAKILAPSGAFLISATPETECNATRLRKRVPQ